MVILYDLSPAWLWLAWPRRRLHHNTCVSKHRNAITLPWPLLLSRLFGTQPFFLVSLLGAHSNQNNTANKWQSKQMGREALCLILMHINLMPRNSRCIWRREWRCLCRIRYFHLCDFVLVVRVCVCVCVCVWESSHRGMLLLTRHTESHLNLRLKPTPNFSCVFLQPRPICGMICGINLILLLRSNKYTTWQISRHHVSKQLGSKASRYFG